MKLFFTCTQTAHACDKSEYKEAGLLTSIMMKIHLLSCKGCRKYSQRNKKLTHCLKSAEIKTLPSDKKKQLKSHLRNQAEKRMH